MRLLDLDPQWVADFDPTDNSHRRGDELTLASAQGILFDCPACQEPQGSHSILAWFRGRGVPDDTTPGPGRWTATETTFADLTLSPSIALTSGCKWHGFVENGQTRTA